MAAATHGPLPGTSEDAEDEMIVQVMRQKQRKECVHMMTKVPRDIRIMPDVRIVMMG